MPVTIGGSGPITGVTSINTSVSDTELGYLDGVTSAVQTQIDGKLATPGAWTSYVPTLGNTWALGNATYTARYTQVGKLVSFNFVISFGTTTTYGASACTIALPVAAIGTNYRFSGEGFDASGNDRRLFISFPASASSFYFCLLGTNSAYGSGFAATTPWTWASGDTILGYGTYEAA